eukprot:6371686-Karenia_brevis.AAC.1
MVSELEKLLLSVAGLSLSPKAGKNCFIAVGECRDGECFSTECGTVVYGSNQLKVLRNIISATFDPADEAERRA